MYFYTGNVAKYRGTAAYWSFLISCISSGVQLARDCVYDDAQAGVKSCVGSKLR